MKLIDVIYKGKQETLKFLKKPSVMKKLNRAFESSEDDCGDQADEAELEINALLEQMVVDHKNAGNYINKIFVQLEIIDRAARSKGYVGKIKNRLYAEVDVQDED